ncbi:hypothetical protein EDB81DRAFT_129655 [Dactylonectria macrodidyma]|uniref:NB-ARC domain-containing protein n=1 Tax=Dactylonectria macrodidyma TaxID=307937 RepID=A0A9P9E3U8_9HYPO|nr:hypothetical protein EDB81DRAFT_129655 [Dactylonectria macrodidyma]
MSVYTFDLGWPQVIGVCIIIGYFYWRQSKDKPAAPVPKRRHITLRIEDIPPGTESKEFEDIIRSMLENDAALTDIKMEFHFLIPRSNKRSCATATFYTFMSPKALILKLDQAAESYSYKFKFDHKFHGITPVYQDTGNVDVDIIAVPGLGSHAVGTWKDPGSNTVWLRDFLPDEVRGIRVSLYGYDTSLLNSESKDSIEDLGTRFLEVLKDFRRNTENPRPIIFIGHSLGGLLIKEALVEAWKKLDNPQNKAVRESCSALLLFGVPNLGLRQEQLRSIVKGRPNESLISDLVVDNDSEPSPFLRRISANFSECCKGKYKVLSFYEREKSPTVERRPDGSLAATGQKVLLVTERSATSTGLTAMADENNISLSTDHAGLVKYGSRNQVEYCIVRANLLSLVSEAKEYADTSAPVMAFTVPFPRDEKFVGRDNILKELDDRLGETDQRLALTGLGGVGKSQIAIEYAHRTRINEPQTSIFWVDADDVIRFVKGYREIAELMRIPGRDDPKLDILDLVRRWLCDENNGRWLMVLDNADDIQTFYATTPDDPTATPLEKFIPRSPNGSILLTSRNETVARNLVENKTRIIEVEPMTKPDALRLFEAMVATDLFLETDAKERKELVEALEGIPLAISHASAYIDAQRITLADYLELFRETEDNQVLLLSNEDIKNSRRDPSSQHTVITTWQISFKKIQDTKPEATNLLALMSMFHGQEIPRDLVTHHMGKVASINALATLMHFSLIKEHQRQDRQKKVSYDMHGLVQLSTRNWLQQHHELGRWRKESLSVMAKAFPSGHYTTWKDCEDLLPHAKAVVNYAPDQQDRDELLQRAKVANNAGRYLCLRGQFSAAESMSQVARDAREEVLGEEDRETLESTNNLALAQRGLALYDKAMGSLRHILEMTQKMPGQENAVIWSSINIMATLLQDKGKYAEAEDMYQRALEGRQEFLGEEHVDTLESMDYLGLTLRLQKKTEKAEEMHRKALAGRQKTLGKDHKDTLSSLNNLSLALWRQGKHEDAESLLQRALDGRTMVLGEDHPDTLTTVDNVGLIQQSQHHYEEAEAAHRKALAGRKTVLGEKHPVTLTSAHNLAMVLRRQSKYGEAEAIFRQVLQGEVDTLGEEHPEVKITFLNLARVLKEQGKLEEAESMERRAKGE